MKVIIRATDTGLYLTSPGSWGERQNEAMQFENSIAALEFCVAQQLYSVEVLLFLGDRPVELPMRLFPRSNAGATGAAPARLCASPES